MASAFAHAAAGAALWPLLRTERAPRYTWALGGALAALPDIDAIGFRFGVPYDAPWGHRGLTHSLAAALVVGGVVAWLMSRNSEAGRERVMLATYLILAIASHGVLDMMTTGGLGVAILAPIDEGRYFLPWRPIAVSPISVRRFFTVRGLAILGNEALWVGLPALVIALLGAALHRRAPAACARAQRPLG